MSQKLLDIDLDNIHAAARGCQGVCQPFAHPADTLLLVEEVRRLRRELNVLSGKPESEKQECGVVE